VPLAAAGTDASSLLHHEMSPLFVAEAKFHTGLGCLLIHHLNGPWCFLMSDPHQLRSLTAVASVSWFSLQPSCRAHFAAGAFDRKDAG
jgi:hypothetical protein